MKELDTYVTEKYNSWVTYASFMVGVGRVNLDPTEVVNEILLNTIYSENNRTKIDLMVEDATLDFYVKKAIKISVISPRSSLRYQCKAERATLTREDITGLNIAEETEEIRTDPDNLELMEILLQALDDLDAPKFAKDMFRWTTEGKSINSFPSDLSASGKLKVYRNIKKMVKAKIIKDKAKDMLLRSVGLFHQNKIKDVDCMSLQDLLSP